METLQEFFTISRKMIYKIGKAKLTSQTAYRLLQDDDFVGEIASVLMLSTKKWDPTRGTKLSTYRYRPCMWAILKKAKKMKNHVSLSSVSQDQLVVQDKNPDIQDMWEVINLLHDNNTITDRQYSWLKLKFEQDMTYEEIGKLHNISRQRANQIIDKAVFEIKKYYAHSTRNNK